MGDYCTISDIRDEGFTDPPYSDARITYAIGLASRAIERVTGRWFESRTRTFTLDGRGTRILRLGAPIIDITEIKIDGSAIDLDAVAIYNRHITSGLDDPDDRNMPRVEFLQDLDAQALGLTFAAEVRWPKGQQNIEVTGKFGYTDYDEGVTADGVTPEGIRQLCIMLVLPELDQMVSASDRDDFSRRYSIRQMKTRDQSITFGGADTPLTALARDGLTGDPQIDRLILFYRRPDHIGAV